MNRPRPARGFSLVELLVVMGILSLLLGLALPAVQSAREAARRTHCASNMRTVAMAWHAYHDIHGMLPPGLEYFYIPAAPSWMVRILPLVEQSAVYDGINVNPSQFAIFGPLAFSPTLVTALATPVPVFLCPSDTSANTAGANCRANAGVGPAVSPEFLGPDSGNGIVRLYGSRIVAFRNVIDGLSSTAMLSERVRGSGEGRGGNAFQDVFWQSRTVPDSCYGSADDSLRNAEIAAAERGGVPDYDKSGWNWLLLDLGTSLYKHGQEPNGAIPDAVCGIGAGSHGMVAARSWHPGAVNVAFTDGSLRSVADGIERKLWRALGTRNGREPLVGW